VPVLRPLLLIAGLLCAAAAGAAEQTLVVSGVQVTVWTPDRPPPGREPVLVFSHGLHGCDIQSRFITRGLAEAGYLVLAPNHHDASCHGGTTPWFEGTELQFLHPEQWDQSTYGRRFDDVRKAIQGLRGDPRFARADWSRLGLVGHSLGGYTVLGLAGAWSGWKLPGVKAVLALAPYSLPYDVHQTLSGLEAPVMYQCGQNDFVITPTVSAPRGSYALSPQPKYYVEFANAGHFAWTDGDPTDHQAILAYALAFLNHYVRGWRADPLLTHAGASVVRMGYDSELGKSELPEEPPAQ
jgi:predicted dienelactone hydrolase